VHAEYVVSQPGALHVSFTPVRCCRRADIVLPSNEDALDNGLGVHTYVACSVQAAGHLRVVAYINPQAAKLSRKQVGWMFV
jgi:hypothetical protein